MKPKKSNQQQRTIDVNESEIGRLLWAVEWVMFDEPSDAEQRKHNKEYTALICKIESAKTKGRTPDDLANGAPVACTLPSGERLVRKGWKE